MVYEIPIQHDMPHGAQMTLQLTGMGGGGGGAHAPILVMYVRCRLL